MPIKATNQELANAINAMIALLKQNFGTDYAYTIMGNGFVLAQSNMNGVVQPTPIVQNDPLTRGGK
jgi:C4-dicarboxylate-specific signal transduction histidine kinase